jgi:hypothetical protein
MQSKEICRRQLKHLGAFVTAVVAVVAVPVVVVLVGGFFSESETVLKREKSIFDYLTLDSVWFWPSNSKAGYLRPSNS